MFEGDQKRKTARVRKIDSEKRKGEEGAPMERVSSPLTTPVLHSVEEEYDTLRPQWPLPVSGPQYIVPVV